MRRSEEKDVEREKRELRELPKKIFVGHVVNGTYCIRCRVICAKFVTDASNKICSIKDRFLITIKLYN